MGSRDGILTTESPSAALGNLPHTRPQGPSTPRTNNAGKMQVQIHKYRYKYKYTLRTNYYAHDARKMQIQIQIQILTPKGCQCVPTCVPKTCKCNFNNITFSNMPAKETNFVSVAISNRGSFFEYTYQQNVCNDERGG